MDEAQTLGLDLEVHAHDIPRIIAKLHGSWLRAQGLTVGEVASEVYRRILVANAGAHPYDPARSKPSTYIARQGRSAICNLVDQRRRRYRHEQLGDDLDAAVGAELGEDWTLDEWEPEDW